MIQALTLGNKTFNSNLICGPLAGVSCAPFRRLIWRYSQPAFTCTEMVSCKTLLAKPGEAQRRFIEKAPDEGPLCFQLAASDPLELGEAVKRVTDYGADLIDLNCGCPVKKIRVKGAGSKLLTDPTKLYQLIMAMKQNTHVPVSVKIRVEGKSGDKFNAEVAQAVSDAGADFLIVHGRHWTEHYETPCCYDDIQFFVEQMKIPVIGNGDIKDLETLRKMFATGCAGVMISRATVGQPWLVAKLTAELNQQAYALPALPEIGALYIEHVTGLIDLLKHERFAVIQARQFAKYYGRFLANKTAFCEAMNSCEDFANFKALCQQYFPATS